MRRVLIIVAIYLAVMFLAHLPDLLILFPTTAQINAHGATRKLISFENGQLELWTAMSQAAQRARRADFYVLRFYGNADRAERWVAAEAEMWNGRAVEIWGMNYPGFGGCTGPARLKRIATAALVAFDKLKDHTGAQRIVLFGASLGATAALHVAASRPAAITGLILHNPPPIRQMILRQFGWWNLWLLAGPLAFQIPAELDSIANARRIHTPAVFLLAEQDEIVAPRFQKMVVDAHAGEKRVIHLRAACHNSPIDDAAFAELYNALDWLLPRSEAH